MAFQFVVRQGCTVTVKAAPGDTVELLAVALHLRSQELSLRHIAARLVIATGRKKGQHPSPATVMRMLRDHDEKVAAMADVNLTVR